MNLVAIVGRPNVGKSTLFNRIIGERDAIVEEISGVTRDRHYGKGEWCGVSFILIDTGGIIPQSDDVFEKAIREQAMLAIEEANSIIFVCDGRDGITPVDRDIASVLRSSKKNVILVVNKCDNVKQDGQMYEFHELGLGEPFAISAMNGRSTGDFLDAVIAPLEKGEPEEDNRLKIAMVGRPNVGKSSITNALLGRDRAIVTPIAGTTRDAIDSTMKFYGDEIVLIDTAGLRRRSHITENIEMYSTMRTARAIERSDVTVVVLDAERGLESQDKRIIGDVIDARKGIIIAVNKWDLIEKDTNTALNLTKKIHDELKTFDYVPIIYISARSKQRLTNLIEMAIEIQKRRTTRISTSKLNDMFLEEIRATPPPSVRGHDMRINYVTQVKVAPPVFAFFCNHPEDLAVSYKRFLERALRRHIELEGVPVSFLFKRKNVKWEPTSGN
ncbi:MAG: ribosome biogenesis GTPase Der [Ignavibacteriae bacterium]|nr:ribosome biogenesis GTPase Der [Ignavibacteriota bacterium]